MINGTLEHLLLGLVCLPLSKALFKHYWEAIIVFLTIEAVQFDILGFEGRLLDTIHDLSVDVIGGLVGLSIVYLFDLKRYTK